jgi:hypothetical protein
MIRLVKHFDANGDEILDEDERDRVVRRVAKDHEHISVPLVLMDGRPAAPAGTYALRDNCGRVCGIGDVAIAMRAEQARADRKVLLANAHKDAARQVRDAKPWQWYRDWQTTHGNL